MLHSLSWVQGDERLLQQQQVLEVDFSVLWGHQQVWVEHRVAYVQLGQPSVQQVSQHQLSGLLELPFSLLAFQLQLEVDVREK